MIDLDGIQIEEQELAELIKKLYITSEDSEESQDDDVVIGDVSEANKEAEEIIKKAKKEAEDILEKARISAKKEAEDIKSEALFQKGKLKEQELFFEKKMVILKAGFAQLEADRKLFEKEKREDLERKAKANSYSGPGDSATMLFAGVNNLLALKKRYKDLIKIFHPDNLCGDTEVLQIINREYEKLMDEFGWVRKAY